MDHYLSLLPITDANIKIFKYDKSSSKQYQFTPVYQKISYLHFFGDQLLLVTNRIVFVVNFVPFFWPSVPCNNCQNFARGKENHVRISNYMCVPKIMIFRCFVGQFLLVTEQQNRDTITDRQSEITGGCPT